MECVRCQKKFTEFEIEHGLLKPVLIDCVVSDICNECQKLILKEWVIKFRYDSELKTS